MATPRARFQRNEEPATAPSDPAEVPGDTGAADIVGRTGEEMPAATHAQTTAALDDARTPDQPDELGPEGVPLNAPGNDGPAISPQAVSRMHRAEDDETVRRTSKDFSD